VAVGRLPGLLQQVRAPVLRLPDGEQVRRDDAVELTLAECEQLFGQPTVDDCCVDIEAGELLPASRWAPTTAGPFRSFRFEAFIAGHPELAHVRRVRSPGQNGSRERGFGTLKYERLFLDQIDDVITLAQAGRGLPARVQHHPMGRRPSTYVTTTQGWGGFCSGTSSTGVLKSRGPLCAQQRPLGPRRMAARYA
jgi:hypothetical protein